MTKRLMMSGEMLLGGVDLSRAAPRRVGVLVAHEGQVLEAEGLVDIPPRKRPHAKMLSIEEIREILSGTGIVLQSLLDRPYLPEPPEDGNTFEANALQKARTIQRQVGGVVRLHVPAGWTGAMECEVGATLGAAKKG